MSHNVFGTFITEIPPSTICMDLPPPVNSVGLWNRSEHEVLNLTTPFLSYTFPIPNRSMPLLELELTLMYVLTQFSFFFLKMFGLSSFIAQIVAGILLGDVGFHQITETKYLQNPMFTFTNQEILNLIALFGYTLFLFLIGVQIDLSLIRKTGRKAVYVGVSNFLVPLMVGMAAVLYFHLNWPLGNGQVVQLLFATAIQCSTTTPVIASLLNQLKILNSELGRLGLSSVLISDLLYVIVVVFGFTAKSVDFDLLTGARNLGVLVVFILIVIYVCRPIMVWMIEQTPKGRVVKNTYVLFIMIAFLFSGLITHLCGMTVTAGPFILGLAVPSGPPLGSTLVKKLDFITNWVFMPVFVITCMMRVTVRLNGNEYGTVPRAHYYVFLATAIIIGLVFVSKFFASLVPALCCKMPIRDAMALALILSSQGVLEMAVYSLARDTWVITLSMYDALVCGVVVNAIIIPPLVKRLYDPKRKYTGYEKRNMSNCKPNSELRILACVTRSDNTPAIINLLDTACPTQESPIFVSVLHLVELVGRTTPIFISHNKQKRTISNFSCSENVILSFDHFQRDNAGAVNVNMFTSITPAQYMHDDICTLALDKLTSLIILPFHRKWSTLGSNSTIESENEKIRAVNISVLETAPCSVGILVNRGRIKILEPVMELEMFKVAMIFLGGNDDREALVFARRMARDSCISLTVIHLLDAVECEGEDDDGNKFNKAKLEKLQEREMLRYMNLNSGNGYVNYVEEVVEDAAQTTTKIRSLLEEDEYDLFIVGRRYEVKSAQTLGLEQWSEFPELGVIGDLLASTDTQSKASVLVVQQQQQK
ncbi:cation/H(+) antiporter 4-like [Argentina anserina]|uniref:cation/H(+) antiporter 4-like n=1 Tax=Argentina anserina TaxID=57926 RepID=UPI0021763EDA|nr:cation/H(+) antiporter 4-like [Potentilla anserina]